MSARPLYRIKDWDTAYETAETRKLENLRWSPMPNKHDGLGFRRLAQQRSRCELLSAWVLMVQVASKGKRKHRGALSRDGRPLEAEDLALMTGFPAPIFEQALQFFSDPKQGWLVLDSALESPATTASESAQVFGSPACSAQSPATPADSPATPAASPAEGKGREGIEGNVGGAGDNASRSPAGSGKSADRKKPPQPTDAEWIDGLSRDPAYQGINVMLELAKANRWCLEHKKPMSRMRFINWLNRCDRPMSGGVALAPPKPAVNEPRNWKAFLNHEYPDSRFAANQVDEVHEWSGFDRQTQSWLVGEMRKKGEFAA